MKKRILSIVLALAMVLALFPAAIFASEEDAGTVKEVADFAALKEAFAAGGDVKLTEDIDFGTDSLTISAGKAVVLDLNGKTISGTHGAAYGMISVNNAADLTIKDSGEAGKIICAAGGNNVGAAIYVEGDLVLDSGSIELTGSWSLGFAVDVKPNSWSPEFTEGTTFVMNGGKVAATDTAVRVSSTSSTKHKNVSASFTMNDGIIESDWDAIFIQHQGGDGVTGGHDCTVEIKAGEVSGANSPLRIYGDAVVNDVVLTVKGGTFAYTGEGTTGWVIENVLKGIDSVVDAADIAISGGAFTGDVSDYVVKDKQCVQDKATGLYTVVCAHGAPANLKFQWADDYSTCVAGYTCSLCKEDLTKNCSVTVETKNPTEEEEGYVKYQASVEIADKTYTDVQTVVLAKQKEVETVVPEIEVKVEGNNNVEVKPPVVVVEPTVEVENVLAADENAAAALEKAVSDIKVDADKIAVEQVSNITAEEITAAVEELKNDGANVTDVVVETKISLDVKVEEAVLASAENNISTLTVNITPYVTTKVSAEGKSVEIEEKAEVTVPVTVTIPLPAGYFQAGQKLTVVHTKDNGEKYTHVVTVQEKNGALVVEFLNENGFSLFSFAPAYAVIDPIANANVADLPAVIAAYYDEIYEVAYYYAKTLGYVDVAVDGLEIAWDALETAKKYVEENVPAEMLGVKNEMIGELINTQNTLTKVIDLLENDDLATVDSLIAEVLGLEEELWKHIETLSKLGYELGLEIDPYIIKLNDAVVAYGELVDATVVDAYNTLVETVDGFVAAYEAWVEKMGAAADQISPELGAAVRKFFNDSAADAVAIVAAYGEEAIFELFDVVGDAAGDIVDVALNLADVMAEYGLTIYEAVKDNPEVQELLAAVKNQLAEVEALVKEIATYKTGAVIYAAIVADKEALLQAAYDELVVLYNELTEVLYSVIDDVDEEAAEALDAALTALCDTLCITYNAADGYLGWLAGRADAMACEILCAVLDNLIELVVTASPIMDQWMYDWLYNNPEEVIAFFIENEAEIDALVAKYGPCVVAVLGYVANTYGPEVLDFIIENPCEALDMFMDWYNKYGYRVWPMIDVYLEALGVYDAIDDQLGVVNDKIMAMLSELDAHILAQIAALNAALKDAHDELRAQIEAEIQALYEQLMAFLKANISAYYTVGPNSYYVALGDAGAYGPAADKLAAELGMTDKYANLTFADASAGEVLANLNAAEIAKADLITLGFGANTFTAAVAADVMNAVFGEIVAKDWAALAGEEGAAAIEAALVELTAYVAEEVEDEAIAALLTAAVESFAYTYINHLVDYVVVSEAIHEINADALLVLVGMHNPMDGVVIDLDGEQLDLGEYLDYLVMLTNIYSFGYALIAEDTIYVDAPAVETNYDGAVMDIMTFVTDLLGFEEAVVKYQPTDAGYKYIQEQIYNALNPTLYEEEACQHGAPANLKFQWAGDYSTCVAVYTCSICGEAFTKECLVEILETKNPTEEEEGYVKYQASVEIAGVTYTDVQTVVLAKLPAPDTGDTTMIGLYVTVMLVAAAGAFVVLKKKKHA